MYVVQPDRSAYVFRSSGPVLGWIDMAFGAHLVEWAVLVHQVQNSS